MSVLLMENQDLNDKRVLIREDLNVPVKNGKVASDARIRAAIPTIEMALQKGAKVILMSHLGRPAEGATAAENAEFTLAPVAEYLQALIDTEVEFIEDWQNEELIASAHNNNKVVLLENVRFNPGEKKNDEALSKTYASLCDVFVMDAFGTAHRAQASTHGVAQFAPLACAGPLLAAELNALEKALANPARPVVAIVGGSKVSTKLEVLQALSEKVDQLVVGGGIANTFLAAEGKSVGQSLCEHDLLESAKTLMQQTEIPLPVDVVTGKEFSEEAVAEKKPADAVADDDMIFDIGEQTQQALTKVLKDAKTIIWNGPVGVFEFDQFGEGTKALSKAIAESEAFSLAGGGDTLAAIDKYNIADDISYISTGGGAFLEFVEGKVLPAVEILQKRAEN